MTHATPDLSIIRLESPAGLSVEINANGSLRRIDYGTTIVNLFLGGEIEGGPANIYLQSGLSLTSLLGPLSRTRFRFESNCLIGTGHWNGIEYRVELRLAADSPTWFWHVRLKNESMEAASLRLVYAQDIALAPYGTVRMNEYYVSQYVDHTPLTHASQGCVLASRQNLPADGKHPWSIIGSLRKAVAYATDARQLHCGGALRPGSGGIDLELPSVRLQHEHSMAVLRDDTIALAPGATAVAGFFGSVVADHAAATDDSDLAEIDRVLALPEAQAGSPESWATQSPAINTKTLFTSASPLWVSDLTNEDLDAFCGVNRRHEEFDDEGRLLSFFSGAHCHVVMRVKEWRVRRPHGHLLRTGLEATPDELALTSTVWMNGVFNSMLTQGHVSFNRFLSTVRSYIGLFRAHGQRIFVEMEGRWQLLDMPSAFAMEPDACRWIYRHADSVIEVRTRAQSEPHEIRLSMRVLVGEPVRFLIVNHVALNGDDGHDRHPVVFEQQDERIVVSPAPQTDLHSRFPTGNFVIAPDPGTTLEHVGGDEVLFEDGQSRQEPYLCLTTSRTPAAGLRLFAHLIGEDTPDVPTKSAAGHEPAAIEQLLFASPAASALTDGVERLADIIPWLTHNAFIHYLSPRGLEQYSGGGWGTRDVTQGPVELLLASGHTAPIRDLLVRVMRAQNADGDWPQWFMFFERDRAIRAGDSHGDIVFWPVLAVAQYLIASGDASVLEERVPYFETVEGEVPTVWQHVERALALIEQRVVQGTALAAYGHGDWNDALQPADPAMRERMCSAWTVTLHHQVLTTLAKALRSIGREAEAPRFEAWAENVRRDFQKLLVVDGVLTGYALFETDGVRYLLHPRDDVSGVRYSSLAMIHALLEDMLTPEQVRHHMNLMDQHLLGPDGIRLFDTPMPYHGGPMRFFQRAESATFFGREIGLMYMHAHLRYAQALARMGEAERFFKALCQANPIGIRSVIPQASLRQANCYYSSSDAAFADRYLASANYGDVNAGTIALDGGWRVYSSGAGIALGLIVRRFLGLSLDADALSIDPVIPAALDGMRVELHLWGKSVEVTYDISGVGCGVAAVSINGAEMQFLREHNPYRLGAARVSIGEIRHALNARHNVIAVRVG